MNKAYFLITVLTLTSCIPIFSGEGEEVKSVQPGSSVNGVGLVHIEKAHIQRTFSGKVVEKRGSRLIPVRYLKVCVLGEVDQELDCGATDELGQYSIVTRLPAGNYAVSTTLAGIVSRHSIKLESEKDILFDFSF